MDVWDDDPEVNGDDLIDQFIIPILVTVSGLNDSESKTLNGVQGIGELTIAYYNFTTDQLVPSSCTSADILTTTITSSSSKNCIYTVYIHVPYRYVYIYDYKTYLLLGDSNFFVCRYSLHIVIKCILFF